MSESTMRELHDHKVTTLNEDHIRVYAVDEKGAGNANHLYNIHIGDVVAEGKDSVGCNVLVLREPTTIQFQNGALKETGINGITDQALIAIAIDRLRGFQSGDYACRENAIALTKLEEALLWTGKRAHDRRVRGVEGTHEK